MPDVPTPQTLAEIAQFLADDAKVTAGVIKLE